MRALIASIALLIAVPVAAQDVGVKEETDSDGNRTLTHEILVPAAPAQVWHAVATVEGWQEWAVPLARAVPGGKRFETSYDPAVAPGAPSTIEQEWTASKEPDWVGFRTTRVPQGFPHGETYLGVYSTFTLEPVGDNATKVILSGGPYPAGEAGDTLLGFFTEGNRSSLEQLRERFVSGPRDWSKD